MVLNVFCSSAHWLLLRQSVPLIKSHSLQTCPHLFYPGGCILCFFKLRVLLAPSLQHIPPPLGVSRPLAPGELLFWIEIKNLENSWHDLFCQIRNFRNLKWIYLECAPPYQAAQGLKDRCVLIWSPSLQPPTQRLALPFWV